jgi:putative glutamine amidotransferase
MIKRIGITMRAEKAATYPEVRDALARDWFTYLSTTFPHWEWILLPNLGSATVEYAKRHGLNGILLSGGNSLGEAPERDASECALLDYAVQAQLPVVGICRGLQVIQHWAGGSVTPCHPPKHAGTHHRVYATPGFKGLDWHQTEWEVNSYHEMGVSQADLSPALEALAVSEEGTVEALRHKTAPIYALQWHPERPSPSAELDQYLLSQWMETSSVARISV